MRYFLLLFSFFTIGCTPLFKDDWDYRPSNTLDKVVNQHIRQYIDEIGGNVCGTGGGGVYGFNRISIAYSIRDPLTIDDARRRVIEGLHHLHNTVNASDELKQYLATSPFPIEEIEYQVQASVGCGVFPMFPDGLNERKEISYAYYANSRIRYLIDVHEKKLPETVHSETYEEALEILRKEKENQRY